MSSDYKKFDPEKLTAFSAKALETVGVPKEDALVTARILVATDLMGIDSHGVAHLANFYVGGIQKGTIKTNPDIKITSNAPSTALMDADNSLGFVAGYRAMNDAMDRAEKTGAGFVSVRNSTHFGAAAAYSTMALERNMIGLSMTKGGKAVIPPGGTEKGAGLNVLSFAVPAKDEAPFILDMCTAVVAGGKIEIAKRLGNSIPEGWAVDADGNPATDPAKVFGHLPLGGTPALGAYKGFGLTTLVDILCSTLSGGLTSPEVPEGERSQPTHFFGAWKIDGFMPVDQFTKGMDSMAAAYHALGTVSGVDSITLPGEMEARIQKERANGIPLHPSVVTALEEMAKDLGIEFDF